jgi:hypothetical protein
MPMIMPNTAMLAACSTQTAGGTLLPTTVRAVVARSTCPVTGVRCSVKASAAHSSIRRREARGHSQASSATHAAIESHTNCSSRQCGS